MSKISLQLYELTREPETVVGMKLEDLHYTFIATNPNAIKHNREYYLKHFTPSELRFITATLHSEVKYFIEVYGVQAKQLSLTSKELSFLILSTKIDSTNWIKQNLCTDIATFRTSIGRSANDWRTIRNKLRKRLKSVKVSLIRRRKRALDK